MINHGLTSIPLAIGIGQIMRGQIEGRGSICSIISPLYTTRLYGTSSLLIVELGVQHFECALPRRQQFNHDRLTHVQGTLSN